MTAPTRPLHPRRGTHDPLVAAPSRAPGSVRRTTSLDVTRPDGLQAPARFEGRARDLVSTPAPRVSANASFSAVVDADEERTIRAFKWSAADDPSPLVGSTALRGFGRRTADMLSTSPDSSLLRSLVSDTPIAAIVSVYALDHAGIRNTRPPKPDLCSGWRRGATLMQEIERTSVGPVVTGPPALPLDDPNDKLAWHAMKRLPPRGMRRLRMLDVRPGRDIEVWAMLRDSHVDDKFLETSVHEYEVRATIAAGTLAVKDIAATPHALPWLECPAAATSATRLLGRSLPDVAAEIRAEFTGITTCSHLNTLLMTLGEVVDLLARVDESLL